MQAFIHSQLHDYAASSRSRITTDSSLSASSTKSWRPSAATVAATLLLTATAEHPQLAARPDLGDRLLDGSDARDRHDDGELGDRAAPRAPADGWAAAPRAEIASGRWPMKPRRWMYDRPRTAWSPLAATLAGACVTSALPTTPSLGTLPAAEVEARAWLTAAVARNRSRPAASTVAAGWLTDPVARSSVLPSAASDAVAWLALSVPMKRSRPEAVG
jgi:hypothetical protein